MKQKIKITDKITGKTTENEINIRNLDHFHTQLNTRAHVFADRRKKDPKYKHKLIDEE